jgi:hypothetical protein
VPIFARLQRFQVGCSGIVTAVLEPSEYAFISGDLSRFLLHTQAETAVVTKATGASVTRPLQLKNSPFQTESNPASSASFAASAIGRSGW